LALMFVITVWMFPQVNPVVALLVVVVLAGVGSAYVYIATVVQTVGQPPRADPTVRAQLPSNDRQHSSQPSLAQREHFSSGAEVGHNSGHPGPGDSR
jgi:hypothetical protein